MNGVMMQYFQWYYPANGQLWNDLASRAPELAASGITAVWIPPCYKGSGGPNEVGYGVYDLFDLGEFDQKGSVRTKYGTKEELLQAIEALHASGVQCYADVVFNHKDGADEIEEIWAQEVDWNNRNKVLSDWTMIHVWTHFTFPGRGNQYSGAKWNYECFDALCYNAITKKADKLYRLKHKHFQTDVSHEHGNYDYLMANDLDTGFPVVYAELMYWGSWFTSLTGVDGFRLDAAKHIRAGFFQDWIDYLREENPDKELFAVGEYWSDSVEDLVWYLDETENDINLFDVPLHYNFFSAGQQGCNYDLRNIFEGTLVKERPVMAVTFVENHDTQPYQSLESTVAAWFKPLAYALILLRRDGYPCIFHGDYYTATPPDLPLTNPRLLFSHRWMIDKFLLARKLYAYGEQEDYFDHPNTIGWIRAGDNEHPGSLAVVLSNGEDGFKWMNMHRPSTSYIDLTEHYPEKVVTNEEGWGKFLCKGGKVSVWIQG